MHKKKLLYSWNFSTTDFTYFEMSWTWFWTFLENVGVSVCMLVSKILRTLYSWTNARNSIKLYIQFHLDIIWCWLDFGVYRSRSSGVIRIFLFLLHSGIGQNSVQLYLTGIILSQSFWNSKHLFIIAVVRSYKIFVK